MPVTNFIFSSINVNININLVAILHRITSIRNRSILSGELIELIRNHFIGQKFHDSDGLRLVGLLERFGAFLRSIAVVVCVVAPRIQFLLG